MTPSLRIKLGPVEVDYEGDEEFLREELPDLVADVVAMYQEAGLRERPTSSSSVTPITPSSEADHDYAGTTADIAGKINASSGSDLIRAAAAHLTFVKGQTTFERQELIDAMKSAKAYYRQSYVSNLTNYLNRLVKNGVLNEPSNDVYALTPQEKSELEALIA